MSDRRTLQDFLAIYSGQVEQHEVEVRDILDRVVTNPKEEEWRKEIAAMWLKKLDGAHRRWVDLDNSASELEIGHGFIIAENEAYLFRAAGAQLLYQTIQIVYESAMLMFSDYLRSKE